MRRFFIAVAAAAALVGSLGSIARAGEPEAEATHFVESLSSNMIAVLTAVEIDADERQGRLRNLLGSNVDLGLIGRYILGDYWEDATPDQRREYQSLFSSYALSVFSRTLIGESLEQVAILGSDPMERSQALVHTLIRKARGETMRLSWRVRRADQRFQAIDLIMDGVSLARTYRSQIDSVVSNLGIGGLLKLLRIKAT